MLKKMRRRSTAVVTAVALAVLTTALPAFTGGFVASAHPVDPVLTSGRLLQMVTSADGSKIDSVKVDSKKRSLVLKVYSAAMKQSFEVDVQRPADASAPRPVLYMLNGGGGGLTNATWQLRTDAWKFLGSKNVNVVQPIGGMWSYYTDWRAADPVLGLNKWKTFFTEELPPLINAGLGTNGRNAIVGLSSSATSVLQLPIAKPGLYQAVASYSGCAQISDPVGYNFMKITVEGRGGGNLTNMYGPPGDPMWAANDPYVQAAKLRGLEIFLSTGTGIPGVYDVMNDPHTLDPSLLSYADQVVIGGAIEAPMYWCTKNMQQRLESLHIPATYDFQPTGTHSWGYWEDALKASWPVLARGLKLPA